LVIFTKIVCTFFTNGGLLDQFREKYHYKLHSGYMESVEIPNVERFKRFMEGLLSGRLKKASFEPWEMALLLDLGSCPVVAGRRRVWLERYRDTVLKGFQRGFCQFPTVSEFISMERRTRSRRVPTATPLPCLSGFCESHKIHPA
jgi:hypothetical protein